MKPFHRAPAAPLLLLLLWLSLPLFPPCTGFAPAVVPRTMRPATMTTTLDSTKKKQDWMTDWVSELQDWFETVTHPEPKKASSSDAEVVAATAPTDDAWIAKELNELGTVEEAVELAVDEPLPVAREVITAQEVQQAVKEPKKKISTPKPKVQKTTYEWLTRDMLKAGKAERESKDWVAEGMKKSGKTGLSSDWVADDMIEAGQAGPDHTPELKKSSKRFKTEADRIAEGMTQVGRNTGLGWIARDMADAGKAREARTLTGSEKLNEQLDTQHEKQYDDVFKGMEKVGKEGSHSMDWVEDDMTRAGKGESLMEKLNTATKDVTYKFEKWQKKRYEPEKIRENMESAGHAEARDWVAQDLQSIGRNKTLVGRKYPAPKKELREWLAQDEEASIASDLEAEGKALGNRRTRKEKISRTKLADLVAADMQMVGKTSEEWVETDMERTGHAEPHLNKETTAKSHLQRETEVFMSSRKPKVSPVQNVEVPSPPVEAAVEVETVVENSESTAPMISVLPAKTDLILEETHVEHPHNDFKHNILRASKKVIMPWKKWKDL